MSDEPRWLTAEEAGVWTPFVVSTMHLFSQLDDELKQAFDITHLDYGVLSQLSFRREPGSPPDDGSPVAAVPVAADTSARRRLRMAELADRFGVGRSHMTYRIARLEGMGLVERCAVADDGRGVAATLTEDGAMLLESAAPMHVETVRRLFVDRIEAHHFPTLRDVFTHLVAIQEAERAAD